MSEPIYAIGDIHGQLDDLRRVHDWIARDRKAHGTPGAKVIHVGDLGDRGPDTKGVIQHLIDGQAAGQPWLVLKGNHDRFLQKFIEDPNWIDHRLRADYTWLHPHMGGLDALKSYGIDVSDGQAVARMHKEALARIPSSHHMFLADLPLYHRASEDVLFVHAGIRPGIPLTAQSEDDLLWIRPGFLDYSGDFGVLVIHGHTMVHTVTHFGNRVDIDTGAGRGDPLSAIVVEGTDIFVLEKDGRRALPPPA